MYVMVYYPKTSFVTVFHNETLFPKNGDEMDMTVNLQI